MKLAVALVVVAACGGSNKQVESERQPFNCKDRSASYVAAKSMGGDEVGVAMDCKEAGPRITRWRTDKLGNRQNDTHPISPGQFDQTWKEIGASRFARWLVDQQIDLADLRRPG